jgi:hypothetical protein
MVLPSVMPAVAPNIAVTPSRTILESGLYFHSARVPRTRIEIQIIVELKTENILNPLVKSGKLMLTMTDNNNLCSKNQKYKSTNRGADNDVNESRPKRKN